MSGTSLSGSRKGLQPMMRMKVREVKNDFLKEILISLFFRCCLDRLASETTGDLCILCTLYIHLFAHCPPTYYFFLAYVYLYSL